jgi:hypothetical protein
MESQNEDKEFEQNVWALYYKEWDLADNDKKIELNERMHRWQELMQSGLTASQAYYQAVQDQSKIRPVSQTIDSEPVNTNFENSEDASPPTWAAAQVLRISLALLGLALLVAIGYVFTVNGENNTLRAELASVKSELYAKQAQLVSSQQSLDLKQRELDATRRTLSSVQSDLASTKTQLNSTNQSLVITQAELNTTKQMLSSAQSELTNAHQSTSNLQATLSSTQQQLSVAQDTLSGLGITLLASKNCYDVKLVDNPNVTNPTWNQVKAFLYNDQTEKQTYIADTYDCSQFSRDVHNNAEKAGIRTAEVSIKFRGEAIGHAINAFLTTDKGLVYIDCTGGDSLDKIEALFWGYTLDYDKIAFAVKDMNYCSLSMEYVSKTGASPEYFRDKSNYWPIVQSSYWKPMGIVDSIRIFW